jgi:hypothetical protein
MLTQAGKATEVLIFTQATEGDMSIFDSVGDPALANGMLPRSGLRKSGPGCLELFQRSAIDGQQGHVQLRMGGLAAGTPLVADVDLIEGRRRGSVIVPGAIEGDGSVFDIPVRLGSNRIVRIQVFPDADGDGAADSVATPLLDNASLSPLLEPFTVDAGSWGHLQGGVGCARDLHRLATADACLVPSDVVDVISDVTRVRRAGDDEFSGCLYLSADETPLMTVSMVRQPVTGQDARTVFLPNLERQGCNVVEQTSVADPFDQWDFVGVRDCGGSHPSTSTFTLRDNLAMLASIPNPGSPEALLEIAQRSSKDLDDDGIPNDADDDVDGDLHTNLDDPDDDNDGRPEVEDMWPHSPAL